MALTGTDRGAGSRSTGSETTYVVSPSGTIATGSLAVLCAAYDNSATGGADPYSSISDSVGNTWTEGGGPTVALRDPGAANDGVVARWFYSELTTQLTISDTVTISFGANTTVSRAYVFHEVTAATGSSVSAFGDTATTGGSTTPSVTRTGPTSGQMVIGFVAIERGTGTTVTGDADATSGAWSTHQVSQVSTGVGGMSITSQRKVTTATGDQTYNPTLGTSSDWATIILAIREQINAAHTSASAAANNASSALTTNAGNAQATGTAYDATVSTGSAGTSANAGHASATATANDALSELSANAPQASATGTAQAPSTAVAPSAGHASATGLAHNASSALSANAGNAQATGIAHTPTSAISVSAGHAQATGIAYNATVSTATATNANAGNAQATATTQDVVIALAPSATHASATATAYNATTAIVSASDPGDVQATHSAPSATASLSGPSATSALVTEAATTTLNAPNAKTNLDSYTATIELRP